MTKTIYMVYTWIMKHPYLWLIADFYHDIVKYMAANIREFNATIFFNALFVTSYILREIFLLEKSYDINPGYTKILFEAPCIKQMFSNWNALHQGNISV